MTNPQPTATLQSLPKIEARNGLRAGLERNVGAELVRVAWLAASTWQTTAEYLPARLAAFPVRVIDSARESVQVQLNIGLASFILTPADARNFAPSLREGLPPDVTVEPLVQLLASAAGQAEAIATQLGGVNGR